MARGMRLSGITIAWGTYIVVSASFMLQVNLWLSARVGDPSLERAFWVTALVVLVSVVSYAIKSRLGIIRICMLLAVFGLSYFLGTRQEYFAEKTHILIYGLLGFLASKDLIGRERGFHPAAVASALIFVIFISAADEVFQKILPCRFGDMKDFATNVIGGVLGIALFLAMKKKNAYY